MKRGEAVYIIAVVIGIMVPGILLFYMFNIPLIPPDSELDPINRFMVDNWMPIALISIITSALAGAILRMFRDKLLDFGEECE